MKDRNRGRAKVLINRVPHRVRTPGFGKVNVGHLPKCVYAGICAPGPPRNNPLSTKCGDSL